ncbi:MULTISPECIES: sulfite exporter TauE/SafE family protein [Shewanella]|uniref:Probable membrane transporter protein n=1 Tax=Shewanella chilikensis TaxID=558541 RepID=A0A6G7LN17_9GAMM|nr:MULTISPECIES: sulfite exporter TauE/SafE family protein [Shewanella]MBO2597955.1 sulfite exporter TauE/SafE family protein [Shewanella algae]MCA0948628.1 sulfite exporter TauE/SafE family protein [Shewanella chilikensis]MCE9850837.1 sulfite exporter TauE/SafE family protein [Shewanella chilikensis]MCL1154317.1 sulfite exporter TauE/SafE family protein [Shewanella chilikensis]MCL1162265.1 sulfite exporter TauE/SafE family protein [Shewanella chilikensis]
MLSLIDPVTLLLASLIIFTGALTQSLIGFGLAVVATPLLYIVDPELVPAPVIAMGFSIALLTLIRERGHLEFNGLQYALLGRLPGGLIGATLLLLAPQPIMGLTIALIVAVAVFLSLRKYSIKINRLSLFIAGIFSGIFGTVAAIGGPPMALLLAGKDASQFRAALSAFFIFSSLIALIILGCFGLLTLRHLWLSLLLLPAVFLGFLLAGRLVGRVDKEKTRVLTLALCALSALLLTIKSSLALING